MSLNSNNKMPWRVTTICIMTYAQDDIDRVHFDFIADTMKIGGVLIRK